MTPQGILVLSAGSKVAIVRIARESARLRGLALFASDQHPNAPARLVADTFVELPAVDSDASAADLADFCSAQGIALVIPTRHGELSALARNRAQFESRGIALPICAPAAMDICLDKRNTAEFLRQIGVPTPATVVASDLAGSPLAGRFPLFAKPATGAASAGARVVRDDAELADIPQDWILQSLAAGDEYTINLYLNRDGETLCSIPHRRIAVESGEVVQAQTARIPLLIDLAKRIASRLPDASGIINIQAFHDPRSGTAEFIEINPRIGGGFPLAHQAKGHFIEWLCQEWLDGKKPRQFDHWTERLRMLRFREALFEIDRNA